MRIAGLLCLLSLPFCLLSQDTSYADRLSEHRKGILAQLMLDPRSPIDTTSVRNLRFFAANDSLVCPTIILPLRDSVLLNFPTSDGNSRQYRAYARLYFNYGGAMHNLTLFESPGLSRHPLYADKLFLPFWDESNGFESYGGGRYLDISRKAVDASEVVLDFNKAYNPWCAYSDSFSCPIPPPENRLPFAVRAGESAFKTSEVLSAERQLVPAENITPR